MNSGKPSCRARFGPYELNPEEHMLRKNGIAIRLQEQPWQVLCALLEKPGAVVTREELRKRLWPEGTLAPRNADNGDGPPDWPGWLGWFSSPACGSLPFRRRE